MAKSLEFYSDYRNRIAKRKNSNLRDILACFVLDQTQEPISQAFVRAYTELPSGIVSPAFKLLVTNEVIAKVQEIGVLNQGCITATPVHTYGIYDDVAYRGAIACLALHALPNKIAAFDFSTLE